MIGLPGDRTRVEAGLRAMGVGSVALGLMLMLLVACIPFISIFAKIGPINAATAFSTFLVGSSFVVAGLCLSALAQVLGSFRLLAHNSHKGD